MNPQIERSEQVVEDYKKKKLAASALRRIHQLIRDFVQDNGVTYTNLVGTETTAADYRVPGLPTAFLIDGEGRIVKRFMGPKPRKVLEQTIRELLEQTPQT